MTDLDLTPARLRKLADDWCPASECRPDDGIEDRMAHSLRALADQMEGKPTVCPKCRGQGGFYSAALAGSVWTECECDHGFIHRNPTKDTQP